MVGCLKRGSVIAAVVTNDVYGLQFVGEVPGPVLLLPELVMFSIFIRSFFPGCHILLAQHICLRQDAG